MLPAVSIIICFANGPRVTLLSENASITGKPAIVLAEKSEPDNSSDTLNNLPWVPSMATTEEPLPSTFSEAV